MRSPEVPPALTERQLPDQSLLVPCSQPPALSDGSLRQVVGVLLILAEAYHECRDRHAALVNAMTSEGEK